MTTPASPPDVFPPDWSSPIGQIRAQIPDVEQVDYTDSGTPGYMFSDAHLEALYQTAEGEGSPRVYRAAASALRAVAVSEGLIQKVIRTEDLQTDGAKLTTALLAGAKQLDDKADRVEEADGGFAIVDFQPHPIDSLPYWNRGFPVDPAYASNLGIGRWLTSLY